MIMMYIFTSFLVETDGILERKKINFFAICLLLDPNIDLAVHSNYKWGINK